MFPTGLANKFQFELFLMQSGNQIRLTYYTGVVSKNPSGNKNIQFVDRISDNRSTEDFSYNQRLELSYDLQDDIILISNVPN